MTIDKEALREQVRSIAQVQDWEFDIGLKAYLAVEGATIYTPLDFIASFVQDSTAADALRRHKAAP